MNIDLNFLENININKLSKKTIKIYYTKLKKLFPLLKDRYNEFNLMNFFNDYNDIVYFLKNKFKDDNEFKLLIQSILYILQYFIINKTYLNEEKYNLYKDKYLSLIK